MEAQREPIESISAVTLLTVNMVDAVVFYEALGFHLLYGGPEAPFTSFRVGAGYLNLQLDRRSPKGRLGSSRVLGRRRRRDVPTGSRGRVRSGNLTRGRTVG